MSSDTRYLLKDHLGSVDVVTDASGAVLERMSFDAWGKRRAIDWTALVGSASTAYAWQGQTITRGYTFHEQLDSVDLVHMNGRVYDPEIGRFMSADIAIADISNSQAFNAYSYVNNNPLSFTDPSGFFLKGLFHKIGNFFRKIGHAVGRVARSGIFRAIVQIIACANPAAAVTCPAAAVGLTLAAGGSIKDALIAGMLSFAQLPLPGGGGIWGVVGSAVAALPPALQVLGKIAIHAAVSGALSVAQGGSFAAGAMSGAVSAVAGVVTTGMDQASQLVVTAAAGGTASVLAGGKFANGAITAAFALMYNSWRHPGGATCGAAVASSALMCGAAAAGVGLAPATGGMSLMETMAASPSCMGSLIVSAGACMAAVGSAASTSAGSSDERQVVFRVVHPAELAHLMATGNYGSNPSENGKYFAKTERGAQNFAGWSANDGYTITSTTLPQSVIDQGHNFMDIGAQGAGPSVHFEQPQLPMVYDNMTPFQIVPRRN